MCDAELPEKYQGVGVEARREGEGRLYGEGLYIPAV